MEEEGADRELRPRPPAAPPPASLGTSALASPPVARGAQPTPSSTFGVATQRLLLLLLRLLRRHL